MATWPGSPSQPGAACYTDEETEAGPAAGPQPCGGEWERPGCALPTCLPEALPSISLPGSSGNHPISAWTTSQVTRSRCYDHPMSTEGAFVHGTRRWTDLSRGGQMTGSSGKRGRCLCQRSSRTHCAPSLSHRRPQARGVRVSVHHPGRSAMLAPSSVSGARRPPPPLLFPHPFENSISSPDLPWVTDRCRVLSEMPSGGRAR